jgi:hypothetical protein
MLELRNVRSAEERALKHLRLSLPRTGATDVVFDRPLKEVAVDLGMTMRLIIGRLPPWRRQEVSNAKEEKSG